MYNIIYLFACISNGVSERVYKMKNIVLLITEYVQITIDFVGKHRYLTVYKLLKVYVTPKYIPAAQGCALFYRF